MTRRDGDARMSTRTAAPVSNESGHPPQSGPRWAFFSPLLLVQILGKLWEGLPAEHGGQPPSELIGSQVQPPDGVEASSSPITDGPTLTVRGLQCGYRRHLATPSDSPAGSDSLSAITGESG